MPRIAFVGAGSTVFARNLIGDVLAQPELAGSTFALMDIDLRGWRHRARPRTSSSPRTAPAPPSRRR